MKDVKRPLEDEASLFSLGSEFLEAAKILEATPAVKMKVSSVAYYLVGHASELLLKSYLFRCGTSLDELKSKYGHDLIKIITKARALGLPTDVQLDLIEHLSQQYAPKKTEYRQLATASYPQLEPLLLQAQILQNHVFSHIFCLTKSHKTE